MRSVLVAMGAARALGLVSRSAVSRRRRPFASAAASLARRSTTASGSSNAEDDEGGMLESDWEYNEKPFENSSGESAFFFDLESVEMSTLERAVETLGPLVSPVRRELFENVLNARTKRCVLAYEKPSNPSNVWACLRTIDAFGVQSVHVVIDGEADARARSAGRGQNRTPGRYSERNRLMVSAMGAQKWLTLSEEPDAASLCDKLRSQGYVVAATDLSPGAVPLSEVDWAGKPHAVVFGNEEVGISDELRAACDIRVYMPMKGFAESLNLSVSTGVVLSHLDSRKALVPDLTPRERIGLLLRWMILSVKASVPILTRAGIELPEEMVTKRQKIAGYATK